HAGRKIEQSGRCWSRDVELRARASRGKVADKTSSDKHLAVGQQSRRVTRARAGVTSRHPNPAGRIVQLRAPKDTTFSCSSRVKYYAIGQQTRRMMIARSPEATTGCPSPARR